MSSSSSARRPSQPAQILLLLLIWLAVYGCSLSSPPLLDDADATHAQAAQAMLRTGDWVTLHVDSVRYLEKAPLPYWIAALCLRVFGPNSFAVHLPLALAVLGLAAVAWTWGNRAFPQQHLAPRGANTGFYAALFTLTAAGVFLFTRIFIPDALLSLLLAFTLYAALRALESFGVRGRMWACAAWSSLALAVLTKGLVALVFVFGAMALYLPLSGEARRWRRLYPATGLCLLLAIAAPWHILAGLRNRGGANGHGFFWFYFINEHVLRFLGRRSPPDYNKLPAALYWSLHLVWLFPWSFFAPAAILFAWKRRRRWLSLQRTPGVSFGARSALLLVLFSALVLIFFSLSTNQEYYTFPVYLPLLLLTAGALVRLEAHSRPGAAQDGSLRLLLLCQAALAFAGVLAAAALAFGLWTSRGLPPAHDIGDLLAHRAVAGYTLSMSHLFDLTVPAFSALRLPASLACAVLALGPGISMLLRLRRHHAAATLTLALTSTVFLIAAHLAFVRFAPLLSSQDFALEIRQLQDTGRITPNAQVLLLGDQAFGSSIPFYLGHPVLLVEGRSTSMLFGSTFPDAPPVFLTAAQLQAGWGTGPRKLLFVPVDRRADAERLLSHRGLLLYENAGKALYTDRPLATVKAGLDSNSPRPKQ